jgi:hypothetical protein
MANSSTTIGACKRRRRSGIAGLSGGAGLQRNVSHDRKLPWHTRDDSIRDRSGFIFGPPLFWTRVRMRDGRLPIATHSEMASSIVLLPLPRAFRRGHRRTGHYR